MNKYKNKSLYRLIPIKVTIIFQSRVVSYFFLCFVVLTLNNKNSVICLLILSVFYSNAIIYSLKISFKPEFLSSAEHKCYLNSCWSTVTSIVFFFYPTIKWTSNCLITHILQNIFFCVQHMKEINTGLGQHVSE